MRVHNVSRETGCFCDDKNGPNHAPNHAPKGRFGIRAHVLFPKSHVVAEERNKNEAESKADLPFMAEAFAKHHLLDSSRSCEFISSITEIGSQSHVWHMDVSSMAP